MSVTIITNNVPRDLFYYTELTDKEQAEVERSIETEDEFIRYKGNVYCTSDFMALLSDQLSEWDGAIQDTFFSGILIKFTSDGEQVIMGRYYENSNL